MDLIQSTESLKSLRLKFPKEKRILPQDYNIEMLAKFLDYWPALQI